MSDRPTNVITTASRAELTNAFMRGVYVWMAVGLLITAGFAWATLAVPALAHTVLPIGGSSGIYMGLLIAQLILVFTLSAAIHKLSSLTATAMFLIYSALNGMTLSALMLIYTSSSVFTAFLTAAGMFGALSVYGLVTKRDLSGMGGFMAMGLFGVVIAMVVNMFVGSSALDLGISIIGVIVFMGLTAYDTQALRKMGETAPMDDALAIRRGSIIGALKLYLDFINIFLMLLRLFGDRR